MSVSVTFRPDSIRGTYVPHTPAECERYDCAMYGPCYGEYEPSPYEMNVSNSNAWALQAALGLTPDYYGEIDADDLLGRVLVALAVDQGDMLDIPSDPATEALLDAMGAGAENGPQVHVGVRHEGYVHDRMLTLHAIAVEAKRLNVPVTWS